MTEKNTTQYVRNPGVFWSSLQSWVKWVIVLFGGLIGLAIWGLGFSGLFPFFALIFLGTATIANVLKVLIILGCLFTIGIFPLVTTWLLRLLAYAIARFVIMSNENASMGDFIFKTKE